MKKVIFLVAFALVCGVMFAEGGENPQLVQAGFYTPNYQCFYLKGSDELGGHVVNEWGTYDIVINKKGITYDGMGGKHKNMGMFRFKSNTEKSSTPLVIYLDNIVVKDDKRPTKIATTMTHEPKLNLFLSQFPKMQSKTGGTTIVKPICPYTDI